MQVLDTGNRRDLLHTTLSDFAGRVAGRMWLWWQNSAAPSICQMSRQLSFFFSKPSQLVHLPGLAIETALACRFPSSCLLTSSTTSCLFCWCCFVPQRRFWDDSEPCPPMLYLSNHISEVKRRLCTLNSFWWSPLPSHYHRGAAVRMTASSDSVRVMTSLTLVHLNSSTSPVIGYFNLPCP